MSDSTISQEQREPDPAKTLTAQVSMLFSKLRGPNGHLILIVGTALAVHLPNLLDYPAWFFDEGAYLTFSAQWQQTGHLSYYSHPFGALLILALLFETLNPATYLIPRLLMVAFAAVDGVLLYKLTQAVYKNVVGLPLVASLVYVATPLSARYLRLVVVDNFMVFFLLLALLVAVTVPRDCMFSALLFGGALVSKQTAVFFIPAILVLFRWQKRSLPKTILWLVIVAIIPAVWILYGTYQVGFSALVSTQLSLTSLSGERAVFAGNLIVQRISQRDPFIFLGLAGLLWSIYKRHVLVAFPLSYILSFVLLFLKISTVYLVPMIPFFSLLGTVLLFDLIDLLQRVPRLKPLHQIRNHIFAFLVLILIVSSLFLVVYQNPATPQQDALNYVVNQHPQGVIVSYTYFWLFKQNYPEISVYDRYAVPWNQLRNQTVYLIVDYPGDLNTINEISQYHDFYFANSTQSTLKVFVDPRSGYAVQVLYGKIA